MFGEQSVWQIRGPWGIPVQVGGSLLLLLLLLTLMGGVHGRLGYDLAFVAVVLGSILLHELGHAWGCRVLGILVRRIVLHAGGGFCQPARAGTRQQDELIVALGPIVNAVLWACASLAAMALPYNDLGWLMHTIAWVNLFLLVYNLIPVQPLDGGRLLHLALARLLPPAQARQLAGAVGLALAVLWLPLLAYAWLRFGFVLLFLPSVALHWQMMTGRRPA